MKPIPLYALQTDYQSNVFNSGRWIDGQKMAELEEKLREYLQVKYVILTNSGTSSLLAAYWAVKDHFSKLLVDPYTFPATYQPARFLGYQVAYERHLLQSKIQVKKKQLYTLVHLFGQPHTLINQVPKTQLIEDACQAFGAEVNGKKAGTLGLIGCYSFYPSKLLHSCGHGGAIVTDDENLFVKMKTFVESGRQNGVMTEDIALNLRMDEIKAEFILAEFANFDQKIEIQRQNSQLFKTYLPDSAQAFLIEKSGDKHTYSVFNLLVEHQAEFRTFMAKNGIETKIYYGDEILPISEQQNYLNWTTRLVNIPNRWNLTSTEKQRISAALAEWFTSRT